MHPIARVFSRSLPPLLLLQLAVGGELSCQGAGARHQAGLIRLPPPSTTGGAPLSAALAGRRSVRDFAAAPLRLADVAQLLWAAQGVTRREPTAPPGWQPQWGEWRGGRRTAPSAGGMYPLELYLLASAVEGLDAGLYRYVPLEHALARVGTPDRAALAAAALGQGMLAEAPAVVIVTGVYARTAAKYGARAPRYVHIEVGAAAENLLLQGTALGLGGVFVGAFRDDAVRQTLGLPADHEPLGLLPVGHPAEGA